MAKMMPPKKGAKMAPKKGAKTPPPPYMPGVMPAKKGSKKG